MKLASSLAFLAVLVLMADIVAPTPWTISLWDSKEKEAKKSDKMIKDEEVVSEVDEGKEIDDYHDDTLGVNKVNALSQDQSYSVQEYSGGDEAKTKIPINDPEDGVYSGIKTISELPNQNGNVTIAQEDSYPQYDREPQQSEFLDRTPHPTESQGMDPRFAARPRTCQEGQYLCRKQYPQQEHVRCIPDEWKCNGVRDCELNDDEESCGYNPHRPTPNQCNHPTQYTCANTGVNNIPAQCIDVSKLCDGTYDCSYGDDESTTHCPHQYARRPEESVAQPGSYQGQPTQNGPPVQQAPPVYNPYDQAQQQPQAQPIPQPAQPPQQPPQQPQPQQQQCNGGRSDEYVKRLEWIDRCFRSCYKM